MVTLLAALAGIIVGAVLTTFFQHHAWLRERRVTEYANVLTTFRVALNKVRDAIQGREMIYTKHATDPGHREGMHLLVVAAAGAVDEFLAAHDRVKLVATSNAMAKADVLWDHINTVRTGSVLSGEPDAIDLGTTDFARLETAAHAAANDLTDAAVEDVLRLRLRLGR